MDLKGLDYNTTRSKITLSEYGREVQKMVDHALTITDRDERQHCAEAIVATMQRMVPQEGSAADRKQKLWDQLAIMSDFKLDIDYPVDITQAHEITKKPAPLPYDQHDIRVRHYGALLNEVFEKLKTMPGGPELDRLIELTANQMHCCLAQWGRGSDDVYKVADDLAYYTDGRIQLDPENFRFADTDVNMPKTTKQDRRRKKK